jgi:hypothetical protein
MRRAFLGVFLLACGGTIAGTDGGGVSSKAQCSQKSCPNDPDPTQAQISSCETSRDRFDVCASVCNAYTACVTAHLKETCGADGRTDSQKAIEVATVTCKPNSECVTCVSK